SPHSAVTRSRACAGPTWTVGWWNIPAELTKTKRPYRVPLTPAMLAIIEETEKLAYGHLLHVTGMGISQFDVARVRHHTSSGSKTSTARYDHHTYDREKRRALDLWNARLLDIVAGKKPEPNVIAFARP